MTFGKKRFCYSVQKTLALSLSVFFHPVMLPTLFFAFAALVIPEILAPFSSSDLKLRFILLILITTMIIPLIMLSIHFMLNKRKINIETLYLHNNKDRVYPFFHTGIFYAGITYLFHFNLHMNYYITSFMGMVALCVLIVAVVSLFYKISAHLIGLSAVTGYLWILNLFLPDADLLFSICALILISGLTASSRLFLQAHSPQQIFAGCIAGVVSSISCFIWLY